MRILIAEDDPVLADGLRRTLRQSGYAVDWAKNGGEADAALGANHFDLLILDVTLPKLSGLEVLKRLRARNSRVQTPADPHFVLSDFVRAGLDVDRNELPLVLAFEMRTDFFFVNEIAPTGDFFFGVPASVGFHHSSSLTASLSRMLR